ncbi:MAG: hypothetical protein QM723_38855 [Myxococcaceae bacterium]
MSGAFAPGGTITVTGAPPLVLSLEAVTRICGGGFIPSKRLA